MGSDFISMWREQSAKQAARIAELEAANAVMQDKATHFDALIAAILAMIPHATTPDAHVQALLDKVKRVGELESTERELREAVKVLGAANKKWVDNWTDRYNKNADGWMIALPEIAAIDANPIAAAAIREASNAK